jgi:hypothetical protein
MRLPYPALLMLTACSPNSLCNKVPLVQVQAQFDLADATWFEEEQTLFIFYTVSADQGIGPQSVVELTYTTDDGTFPWTEVGQIPTVQIHVPAVCTPDALCGSTSVKVPKPPRDVGLQLRWARGGELTLPATVTFNIVNSGSPWTHRSLIVYGVLDQPNTLPQWRSRNVFPTLRNEQVTNLGLRRTFTITDEAYGTLTPGAVTSDNPYGYGFATECPSNFVGTDEPGPVTTTNRAIFDGVALPVGASPAVDVCATSTVTDATGTFAVAALAQKNPEVRPAFPELASPIRTDTQLPFLLEFCQRTISEADLEMQEQRIGWTTADSTICLDNWQEPGFAGQIAGALAAQIDTVRAQGNDMIVTIAFNHDDTTGQLAAALESALDQVLVPEATKSSPRAVGAFVLDSYAYAIETTALQRLVLWCPASPGPGGGMGDNAATTCPVQPDSPGIKLGPFTFNALPILPTRAQYLAFIAQYSVAQAGAMTSLKFLAPERTPISQDVQVGDFGVATFFNDEILTAAPTDAFSYCNPATPTNVVFRTAQVPIAPLSALPDLQNEAPQGNYDLGLGWDFPFLMRLDYSLVIAGEVTAFSVTVPFGVGTSQTSYYGTQLWLQSDFPLSNILLQCTRFCDDPTFDSAGVYEVESPFRKTYADVCYGPIFPSPPGTAFPIDP